MLLLQIARRSYYAILVLSFVALYAPSRSTCGAHASARTAHRGTVSLQGQVLVATTRIDDGYFEQSRIYLLQHDASGALGVVLNKGEVAPGVTEGGPVGRADTIELVDARGHARVFQGYAGWAPGQLERELRMGAWRVQPGTAHDVLDP